MDIWSWVSELPDSGESDRLILPLASSNSGQSIHLTAERTRDSDSDDSEASIVFSIYFVGFSPDSSEKPVWISNACPLSSEKLPFLPLVLQLLQEIVSRAPNAHGGSGIGSGACPRSQLQKLKPDPVAWTLDSHAPESFSNFFDLVFLTRLFWLCVVDAPSEVGAFYFDSVLAPNLEALSYAPVLRNFFINVGIDVELCFMRTFGYILTKLMILKEIELGLKSLTTPSKKNLGFAYAVESHGLWILRGYSPVKTMKSAQSYNQKREFPAVAGAKESFLKYALAHQQLEAVIQLEYAVEFFENYIQVNARVDNLRFHVAKLGFQNQNNDGDFLEKYFPSRIRVWVGPEVGASYVGGVTLSRSTENVEREMETQKTLKGKSGNSKGATEVKATARIATRTKIRNWRWDQDVEGNTAVFEATLCDNTSGVEVATWRAPIGGGGMGSRYAGGSRVFTKSGGLVFAGEECGGVGWRVGKEMEGSVLKWRIGGSVWVSYWPNDLISSSYFETRCVEWCDEVDLPLIPAGKN